MIVTVFRSRLRPEAQEEYSEYAQRMSALAKTMPGYISHKTFVAEDGERCTIAEFEDEASVRAWSSHEDHAQAKRRGREAFYSEYDIKTCTLNRAHQYKMP